VSCNENSCFHCAQKLQHLEIFGVEELFGIHGVLGDAGSLGMDLLTQIAPSLVDANVVMQQMEQIGE